VSPAEKVFNGTCQASSGSPPSACLSQAEGFPLPLTASVISPIAGRNLAERRGLGKAGERTDACRGESRHPDNGREGGGSRWLRFAAPRVRVKEKAKAFHVSADVQLKQDSKREGKAGGD